MRPAMEDGVTEVLSCVVEDVGEAINRNVSGAHLLQELLSAPWLHALLKIYECLLQFQRSPPIPFMPYASELSHEIMTVLQDVRSPSAEARELYSLLSSPLLQALLWSQDSVSQSDFGPVLPPLPDDMPEDEEAMRIVCLVKNNQPLGATIRRDDETGEIFIARVIHGGLADRSGLLQPGDLLVEVNGNPVAGLEPEQVIQILINSQGTILFKVIPMSAQRSSQASVFMKAMVDYCPLMDATIPCPNAGMEFSRGDLLEVVDQSDAQWWQARKLPCTTACAGLIPSASVLKSKQREQWWSQPSQGHTCIKPLTVADSNDDRTRAEDKLLAELEEIQNDEADSELTDGIYLAGFRRSFRLWRRTSFRRRRQSCSTCSPGNSSLATPYEEMALYQREPGDNHRLIVLIGATGVGVNELRKRLIKQNPSIYQGPVPHTTRPMRAGEQTGREYNFVTKELFEYMICNQRFVEYGEYKGFMYGTSTDAIDEVLKRGQICITDVGTHSLLQLRTGHLKPYVIFIKPPSSERLRETRREAGILTRTCNHRAFTEEDFLELEETSFLIESKLKQLFDCVCVNEELHSATMRLSNVIQDAQEEPQWIPVSWGFTDE